MGAVKSHGPSVNIEFTATEDETVFRDSTLSGYDAVVFLSTSGEGESGCPYSIYEGPPDMPLKLLRKRGRTLSNAT